MVLDPVLYNAFYQKGQILPEQLMWAQLMERSVFHTCNVSVVANWCTYLLMKKAVSLFVKLLGGVSA